MSTQPIQPKVFLVLLALGIQWGAAFMFLKVLVNEISPLDVVVGRLLLGSVAVLAAIPVMRVRIRVTPGLVVGVAVVAFLDSVIPFTIVGWAEQSIDSGVASVVISTMPLFTVFFASLFLPDERLAAARLAALGVGFAGVVVLAGGNIMNVTDSSTLGILAVVLAAASYGAGAVVARMLLRTHDAISLTGLKLPMATAFALAICLGVQGTPSFGGLSTEGWLSLLVLGVVATGLAHVTYFWVVSKAGSVQGSLVTYIIPVSGLLLGALVLGETIRINTIVGMALIIASVAAVMYGAQIAARARSVWWSMSADTAHEVSQAAPAATEDYLA